MSVETLRSVLLWCGIINYGILIFWAVVYLILPHELLKGLISRWYHIPPERFDELNYNGIVFYKILITFFNIVPCIALWIVG